MAGDLKSLDLDIWGSRDLEVWNSRLMPNQHEYIDEESPNAGGLRSRRSRDLELWNCLLTPNQHGYITWGSPSAGECGGPGISRARHLRAWGSLDLELCSFSLMSNQSMYDSCNLESPEFFKCWGSPMAGDIQCWDVGIWGCRDLEFWDLQTLGILRDRGSQVLWIWRSVDLRVCSLYLFSHVTSAEVQVLQCGVLENPGITKC